MKRAIVFAVAMLITGPALWAAPFTQGNLVILRVGDGTEALTNAGNSLFLDEYTTNGVFVQSVEAPTNQFVTAGGVTNYPIDLTGGNVSEGQISLSTDGRYVVVAGFGTNRLWEAMNGGNISATAGAGIPRVVAVADANGNFDTSTANPNDLTTGSGSDIRGVASTDGSNFWIAMSNLGVCYTTLGSSTSVHVQGTTVKRTVYIFNPRPETAFTAGLQQVYNMAAGGVFASGTNYPTTLGVPEGGLTNIVNNGGALSSPYGFLALHLRDGVSSNIDTVYVADDGSLTGGISKWTYNPAISNFWFESGSISATTGPNAVSTNGTGGVRQLTGAVSVNGNQTNVTLYVVASANTGNIYGKLFRLTDTSGFGGVLSGSLPAPAIASAPASTIWRGIAYAPANTLQVTSVAKSGSDVPLTWNARGGRQYVVQASSGDANGNYNGTYTDISSTNMMLGFGPVQGSYVDVGGATNRPARYYRVKLVGAP